MATHEDKIRSLLESSQRKRLSTAMEAGQTAENLAQLQQQLAATEAQYGRAYKAAVDAGWSDKELRQIGLTKPGSRTRKASTGDQETPRDTGTP